MIGNSLLEYIFIRASNTALRLIAPLSFIHLIIYPLKGGVRWLTIPAIAEASFYLLIYLPRRRWLQAPPTHPPHPLTQAQRRAIFTKCLASSPVHPSSSAPYPTGPKREDVVDWLLWALFSSTREEALPEEWRDELDGYLAEVEGLLGRKPEDGHGVKSMRLTLDPVVMLHRPLLWYLIVGIVDVYTSIYLFSLGFRHYSPATWFQCFPPRPLLSLFSRRAPKGVPIPYWYRPHRSTTKLPIVFLHGIGIGLYPYIPFIRDLLSPSFTSDSDVGILLPELLPISFHMTPRAVPPRPEMLVSLNIILESLHKAEQRNVVRPLEGVEDATTTPPLNPRTGWSKVVLAAHSYGTFIAGWIVRDCVDPISSTTSSPTTTPLIYTEQDRLLPTTRVASPLSSKIAHLVLVDPIPILLSHPAVAHNFVYRHPSTTSCKPPSKQSTLGPASSSAPLACPDHTLKSRSWSTLPFKYPLEYSAASAWQLWYFASRDADVARTLSRAFFWEEGGIWREEIWGFVSGRGEEQVNSHQRRGIVKAEPEQGGIITSQWRRRNVAVVLAGGDQIVPAEAVRRYLTGEDEICTRWVSGEQEEHGDGEGEGEGEEGDEEGKVEVLFNPRLDHANVFETEENRGDLMEVLWRYVRCV